MSRPPAVTPTGRAHGTPAATTGGDPQIGTSDRDTAPSDPDVTGDGTGGVAILPVGM